MDLDPDPGSKLEKMDPEIFDILSFFNSFCPLDLDPGSQNVADPMDPDLKHCHLLKL